MKNKDSFLTGATIQLQANGYENPFDDLSNVQIIPTTVRCIWKYNGCMLDVWPTFIRVIDSNFYRGARKYANQRKVRFPKVYQQKWSYSKNIRRIINAYW